MRRSTLASGTTIGRALFTVASLTTAAMAQDAPDRLKLEPFRQRVLAADSPSEVRALATGWAAATTGALERMGVGFADLRLHELGDEQAMHDAWREFDELVRSYPQWPYPRLGLAMSALAVYASGKPIPAAYDDVAGGTHYDGYVIELRRLLAIEPDFRPALDWVARAAAAEGDREQPKELLRLLSWSDSAGLATPDVPLVFARATRTAGQYDSSLAWIRTFRERGGDPGIAALERARTLAYLNQLNEAAASWSAGLVAPSGAAREAYRDDLEWVATPAELARYDSLPADSLAAFGHAFWARREARDLRPEGTRLEEHLRRWAVVHRAFRVPDARRRTAYRKVFIPNIAPCMEDGYNSLDDLAVAEPSRAGQYRVRERMLDHRAVIYMRHGEPLMAVGGVQPQDMRNIMTPDGTGGFTVTSANPAGGAPPVSDGMAGLPTSPDPTYSTWVYLIGGQPRIFTFQPNPALGTDTPSTLVLNQVPNLDMLLRLESTMPGFSRLAGLVQFYEMQQQTGSRLAIPLTCQRPVIEAIAEQRDGAATAVRTDSYLRRMREALDVALQAYAIGQPSLGTGQLLVAFAVPASGLVPDPTFDDPNHQRYLVRVEAAIIDTLSGNAVRQDTTIGYLVPRISATSGWLPGVVQFPLPIRGSEVRVAVLQGGEDRGALLAAPVAPAGGPQLAMSDVVLGRERAATWVRGGQRIPVTPFTTFRDGEALELYYEAYGMGRGLEYRTRVTLREVSREQTSSSLSFTDKATQPVAGFSRRLVLSKLKPGAYVVRVSIEPQAGGPSVARERVIRIVR